MSPGGGSRTLRFGQRPFRRVHERLAAEVGASLDFLADPRARGFFVQKGLAVGLRFEATDLDWTWGDGPAVRGTAEALMLALPGRTVVLAELAGDGVTALRERLAR